MGPRPRQRTPAPPVTPRPAPVAVTTSRQVAPIGAPSPRRAPIVETAPLPADTRRALSGIVQQLRNVPRNLIGDPAEVVHFLGRTARALERVRDAPVPIMAPTRVMPRTSGSTQALPSPSRALSARDRAEAVFRPAGGPPAQTSAEPAVAPGLPTSHPRIVMDRKGRGVRVEVRRAREAGQMEMFGQS